MTRKPADPAAREPSAGALLNRLRGMALVHRDRDLMLETVEELEAELKTAKAAPRRTGEAMTTPEQQAREALDQLDALIRNKPDRTHWENCHESHLDCRVMRLIKPVRALLDRPSPDAEGCSDEEFDRKRARAFAENSAGLLVAAYRALLEEAREWLDRGGFAVDLAARIRAVLEKP